MGAIAFYMVLGFHTLNPQNISWLEEGDLLMHYLGWSFYRFSPSEFIIGLNRAYGANIASSIVYTDSIPLLAILLKFRALISNSYPNQIVDVRVNGKLQQNIVFRNEAINQLVIPLNQQSERGFISIELRLPLAISPKLIGLGDDSRVLIVGLISTEFIR